MTNDLRARVRAAINATATLRGLDGPSRTELATVPLDAATDAVMAVLDETNEATHVAPESPPRPSCDWFAWIGQPFYSCDRCGQPAWEHKGRLAPPESPFGAEQPETGIEWTDEERESCRRKWEPAMLDDPERRAER